MVVRDVVSKPAVRWSRRRLFEAAALAAGGIVGIMTLVDPTYAAVGVVALAVVVAVALSVDVLPLFLVTTIFVESLTAAPGVRIGRVAAVFALVVVAYYLLAGGRTKLRPNALLLVAGAYGAWIMLSFYWADDHSLVVKTAGQYGLAFAYMLALAVLVRSREQLKPLLAAMVAGSVVFGLISFVLHSGSIAESRLSGLQGGANFFALYQLVVLPAVLFLAAVDRRVERRPLYYGVIGFLAVSVVLSQSRMGLILFIAVVLLTLVLPARFFFAHASQKFAYASVLLLIGSLVGLAAPGGFLKRASTILTAVGPEGDQGSGRLDLWRAAWHAFEDNPWFGLGAGNFYGEALSFLQQTPGVRSGFIFYSASLRGRPTHSIYLDALADLGIVGLAIVLLLIGLTGRYLLLAQRRARAAHDLELERVAIALFVMLVATAGGGIFLSIGLGKLLWILVGLALALDAISKGIVPPSTSSPPVAASLPNREPALPPEAGPALSTFRIQRGSPKRLPRPRGL